MKNVIALLVILSSCLVTLAQDSIEKIMEKRAREMHRVINLEDKAQWKKFIKENYTQALIDRPMRAKVQTSDNDNTTSSTTEEKAADKLEAKAAMFSRLHDDFGNSKIISIKTVAENLVMVVKGEDGMMGTFKFKFENKSPYLIDALGIEVGGDVNR